MYIAGTDPEINQAVTSLSLKINLSQSVTIAAEIEVEVLTECYHGEHTMHILYAPVKQVWGTSQGNF